MSDSSYVFDGTRRVKPIPVLFGGVEAEAIEIMDGAAPGVYVWMREERITYAEYKGFDGEGTRVYRQRGRLQCDGCTRFYEFHAMGQWSFPFSPLPGWMVWGPSALTTPEPHTRPQELKVRVLCDVCSKLRDKYVRDLFEYGQPLAGRSL